MENTGSIIRKQWQRMTRNVVAIQLQLLPMIDLNGTVRDETGARQRNYAKTLAARINWHYSIMVTTNERIDVNAQYLRSSRMYNVSVGSL